MHSPPDTPLALIGYSPQAARACRELGLIALSLPCESPSEVAQACQTLRFSGALIAPPFQTQWIDITQADPEARRIGKVDSVAFPSGYGQPHGAYTFADALADAMENTRYASRGASAMIFGRTVSDLHMGAPLLRQGFTDIALVADNSPEAEKAIQDLPSGLRLYPMSRKNDAILDFAQRTDVVLLVGGSLPPRLLQPYHTLIDLTGKADAIRSGATILSLEELHGFHIARQLAHATGQRFVPEELGPLVEILKEVEA